MAGKTIKLVLICFFLVMTSSISMGMVINCEACLVFVCEQWLSKACLIFVVHTFLKHFFSVFDLMLTLNWKQVKENWTEIKVDLAWTGTGLLMIVAGIKIKFLGLSQIAAMADILKELIPSLIGLWTVRSCKFHRNQCQDIRLLEKSSLASDSARTTFSFLENIIKGKKETMKKHSKGNQKSSCFFEQILKNHFEKEKITASHHSKLVILFPEGREGQNNAHALAGGVEDILGRSKEKEKGSQHALINENISYEYYASSGGHRRAQLEVLKFFRDKTKFDVIYVAIIEIRLLRTFYQMLSSPCVDFRWENFQMQFNVFRRRLTRLLDEDEGCRGRWEMLHYTEEQGAFTQAIKELLQQS